MTMETGERPDRASIERVAQLSTLPVGRHVHVSGICGTGVSAVAVLLKQMGYRVTGSDKAFYPPMGDVARQTATKLYTGYSEENLEERPDFVIIGNNLSRGNPEVERVLRESIPYASMPEAFAALLIRDRESCPNSVVVCGTHGKTTTSAATTTMLDRAGRKPGFFIGGLPNDLPTTIRAVDESIPPAQRVVVLEGDEYDSAFFAKWSKFHSYRADIAIITSLEFDHADIFQSIDDIVLEFTSLVSKVPPSGLVLLWDGEPRLKDLAQQWRSITKAPIEFYGDDPSSSYRLLSRSGSDQQQIHMSLRGTEITVSTTMTGHHNALNLLAAATVGHRLGLAPELIGTSVSAFTGVRRRQNVVEERHGRTLIEDFAHHPTAVRVTLNGLRERYPDRRLIAVFEPRSNTSRRGFFQKEYAESFGSADVVILQDVADAGGYTKYQDSVTPLDVSKIASELKLHGKIAEVFPKAEDIASFLDAFMESGDVIVCMSNGDFGGLVPELAALL
ncbi:MAG: UDP-N-acetylmuramate:L-alanyl-gamma-D-glutamyl-meso-diaminopimelate ligase [Deltaproteobacteria bacterium]|nr:UDP-N-acetylmuramate:L-alanyl-gamma-D-glutamyl-meso-diaminopimelate ligase [Deltaproteobacteria bacterium]